ncbi:MAG: hypothetical protein K6F49_04285 [Saccharofermentans sp.]|nr:hypothetical protein [Saccharofermentans sp.]
MQTQIVVHEEEARQVLETLRRQCGLTRLAGFLIDDSTLSGAMLCRDSVAEGDSLRIAYEECEQAQCELIHMIVRNVKITDRNISDDLRGRA